MQGPLREDLTRISTPFRGKDKDLERIPPWAGRCDKVRWRNKATPPRGCRLFQRPRVGRPDWQYMWNPRFQCIFAQGHDFIVRGTQLLHTEDVNSAGFKPLFETTPNTVDRDQTNRPRTTGTRMRMNSFFSKATLPVRGLTKPFWSLRSRDTPTSHNCLRTPRLPATACHGPWTVRLWAWRSKPWRWPQKKTTFGTSKHRGRRGPFGAPSSPSHLQLCSLMTFGIKVILIDFGQGASTRFLQNDLPSIQEQPLATVTMQAPPQRYLFATKHTVVTRALGLAFARPTTAHSTCRAS